MNRSLLCASFVVRMVVLKPHLLHDHATAGKLGNLHVTGIAAGIAVRLKTTAQGLR